MNLELIKVVYSDLIYLKKEWKDISNDDLRRSSTVLRGLLLQNNLQKAWNEIFPDTKCSIRATSLKEYLKAVPLDAIKWAAAGGARYKGSQIYNAAMTRHLQDSEVEALTRIRKNLDWRYEVVNISKYCEIVNLVISGVKFCRRDIIDFVANKLGGGHFDQKRNDQTKYLDDTLKTTIVNDKNAIYYELLSTGQFLVNSGDIEKFMTRCKEIL